MSEQLVLFAIVFSTCSALFHAVGLSLFAVVSSLLDVSSSSTYWAPYVVCVACHYALLTRTAETLVTSTKGTSIMMN